MSDHYRSRLERRKARSESKGKLRILKKTLLVIGILIVMGIFTAGIAMASVIKQAPELKPSMLDSPLTTIIYDKDGKPVAKMYDEQNRVKVDISDVPKMMKQAVTSIEDRRFYDHSGVDVRRIISAAVKDITKGRLAQGGSTITQQVVKISILSPKKTFSRKIQEAWLSIKLEQKYTKDQILDMYLNKIYYGERAYGIATASETYFGTKDLSKLNVSQMALLAGLPNAPSANDPYTHPKRAAERRNQVLNAMVETGAISKEQAQKAKAIPIKDLIVKGKKGNKDDTKYEAFVDTVYRQLVKDKKIISDKQFFQGGLKIYTTLDRNAQKKVYHLIHSNEIHYPDKYFETGMALIDTQTGAVRAIGGGRDFKAITYTNYGSQVQNPTGSTMKPVIDYGPAIEYLHWSTTYPIADEPYSYKNGTPIHDWDGDYMGSMTLRNALAYSRNIPALKTMYAVGKDKAVGFAEKLGLDFKKPVNDAAAIGSYEPGATPLQMAGAYAAFGNKGVYNEPYTVTKIVFPDGKTIKPHRRSYTAMHDYTAYMITDVLKSVIEYGTGKSIQLPGLPVAGKTGSVGLSDEFRQKHGISDTGGYSDEWFTGYTTQYTASIWTGYPNLTADGKVHYMSTIESKNIAKEIFEKLMADISDKNVPDFEKPESVVEIGGGELAVRGEQSTRTSEPSENRQQQKTEEPKKQSPTPQNPEPKPENKDDTDSDRNSQIEKPKNGKNDEEDKQHQSKGNTQNGNEGDKNQSGNDNKHGQGNETSGDNNGDGNGHSGDHSGDGQGSGNSGNENGSGQGNGKSDDHNGGDHGEGNSGDSRGSGQGKSGDHNREGTGDTGNNGNGNENHNGGDQNH